MQIILHNEYKSLKPFRSDHLNDLTIITGKNGSGKSQLLHLITQKFRNHASVSNIIFEIHPNVKRIQSEGIIKDSSLRVSHELWKNVIEQQLNIFKKVSSKMKNLIDYIIENKLDSEIGKIERTSLLSNEDEYHILVAESNAEIKGFASQKTNQINRETENRVLGHVFNSTSTKMIRLVKELCANTGKKVSNLIDADFYNTPLQEYFIDNNDFFSSQIEMIFYNYAKRRDTNRKNYFYKKEEGENNSSVSDEQFINTYTPPWDLINNIFIVHKIDFYFKGIEKKDFAIESPIDFGLYKKPTNQLIQFNELSSGEKVIIGLIIKLFTSEYYGSEIKFPDLLILDEPDAHLHPEMSKLLLDVLEETFVKKYKVRVILTTHSPSTIALAPENSIYQLTNGEESGLRKISKDDALKILTSFIPTLSIDYKNHKQVFVESPTDVTYYQTIHDKHQQYKRLPYNLYFISNTSGKSNCAQVYKIVESIRISGNMTSFGVVDWDLINQPNNYVYVHGLEERYSIENFILDPIYIICLLIEMNAHSICENLGIGKTYNQYLIGNEKIERIQEISRYFFKKFEEKFPSYKYDSQKDIVEYLNEKKIEVPKWYLTTQGHDLVNKLKVVFTALNKYKTEGELQNALTIILGKCYPFVPLTTIKLLENI